MNNLYQSKVWGSSEVCLSPEYLGYIRLKYCLEDLDGVSGRILDAGCGGGGFAKAIKHYRKDLDVYAIDIGKTAISQAKKHPQGVHFSRGSIYTIPFEKNFFDAVVIADVFEHLQYPEKAFQETCRILKKNGTGHFFIPLEGEWFVLHSWMHMMGWKAKERLAGHIQRFMRRQIHGVLEKNNFSIMKNRYSGYIFSQIIDIGFYTLLEMRGTSLPNGLEQHLEKKSLLKTIKNSIARITNYESLLFSKIPGSGLHITVKKI